MTAEYASDILDRVTNITYRASGGDVIRSFAYSYDASSLITQKVSVGQASPPVTNSYAYDGLGRLVSEASAQSGTNALTHFSYDLAGNRLSVSSEFSVVTAAYTNNRLTAVSDGTSLAYDAAGCVTNMVRDGVTLSLAWNAQRQLVSVSTNGAFAESYAYDALGRRVSTTRLAADHQSLDTEYHVYDGDECVADLDTSGNPLRSYTWGQGIDNLLAVTVYGETATNTYYAVKDHLGSVHALVDASGQLAASYTYDAWGNVQSAIGNGQSAIGNRYLFQGREYSFATGLYNFRARWYAPEIGRWLSNDPIGISGGLNLYEFCANNPVNFLDPDGLDTYRQNRKIGGQTGTDVRSNKNGLTHTFIFTTDVSDPDNEKVDHTYSWGNKNDPHGWSKDQPEDISAAEEALKKPGGLNRIGGEELDPYVEEAYNCEANPRNKHRWWPWNQCKTEADKLLKKAHNSLKKAQNGMTP